MAKMYTMADLTKTNTRANLAKGPYWPNYPEWQNCPESLEWPKGLKQPEWPKWPD